MGSGLWAKIVGHSGYGYLWQEVKPLRRNDFLDGERRGVAHEVNSAIVDTGKVVRVYPGPNGDYLFKA